MRNNAQSGMNLGTSGRKEAGNVLTVLDRTSDTRRGCKRDNVVCLILQAEEGAGTAKLASAEEDVAASTLLVSLPQHSTAASLLPERNIFLYNLDAGVHSLVMYRLAVCHTAVVVRLQ